MISTLLQYQLVSSNIDRSLEIVAQEPTVERETAYYLENIENIDSIDDFLEDDRIFAFAMKAHGLEEMTYAKAFMRKVLEEGVDETTAFANQLADDRYVNFAETFNFARYGDTATVFSKAQEGTVENYARQTLEESEGESNAGVRLALYFSRKAADISSAYDVLADQALAETVYTALGLPDEFAMSDIDKQAEYISEKIDFEQLGDPEYVDELLQRFSALYDLENGTNLDTVPNLQISNGTSTTISIGESLLASIQSLKLGGS
ncbi:MAG: DUF1217 domain-containing protein [Roseobacter sp.]|uniref:DUF1217 domain-containing protein n=2 Tax=Roseibium sp. TaxID=1936156 RepID=UPI003267B0E0